MAHQHKTTFGELQADERYKQLQLSIKLETLKQECKKNATNDKIMTMKAWPSTSSINFENLDSSYTAQSHQNSIIRSEIIASSNNLRNMLLRKNSSNIKKNPMVSTSSVKHFQQNNYDRLLMPPPVVNTVGQSFKGLPSNQTVLNYKKAMSTVCDRSIQLSTNSLKSAPGLISANSTRDYTNTFAVPTTSIQNYFNMDRTFTKWRVMLNNQYELIIKGTLECGQIVRSKPVIRRISVKCVESKYKSKYTLQGNIVDERNALPDYVRGKFYNGFPDDWENVYQVWRTYVSQGCPVTFHWPTPITDSDDDLKTEVTDATCLNINQRYSATKPFNRNKCTKTENLGNSITEKNKKYRNYSAHSSHTQSCQNTSFVKPFISDFEKNEVSAVEINEKSLCNKDNEQNSRIDITSSSSPQKITKIQDILQEDKLNIIINNLADKNCSSKYINKFFEMFDCLDYMVSYKSGTECSNDLVVSPSNETFNSEVIPLKQNLTSNYNCANTNKLSKLNSGHSLDLGYGSIKNDLNTVQLSNVASVEPRQNKSLDESESETYAGVCKIPIEQVLKVKESFRKKYRHKIKKKCVCSNIQKSSLLHEEEKNVELKSTANSVVNTNKDLFSESCISISEDNMEIINDASECSRKINIQRPQEMFFDQEIQINNFDKYKGEKSITRNKQFLDFEAQRDNLNVLTKEQKLPYRNIKKDAQLQLISDIYYTKNSDIDVVTVSSSSRKTDENVKASRVKMDENNVITSKSNSVFSEKLDAVSKIRKKFFEQDIETKSKPTIISSMPVHLNLKIQKQTNSQAGQTYDVKQVIKNQDKQDENNQLLERTKNKSTSKTSVATKSAINDSHLKIILNNKKEICLTAANKNKSENINLTKPATNPTTKQPKTSELDTELNNFKVLTSWMPNVVHYKKSKTELGLTFKGKLLNEVGHVVNRNFTTNIIAKRISATLIETVDHEFYQLLGHLNDNKRTIPKELVRQCRYGCPTKIDQFCLEWKNLMNDTIEFNEKLNNTTVDSLNAPVSSRGRRILPPLSYWTGERVSLKDNNPVYSPGLLQENILLSPTDSPKKVRKDTMNVEKTKKERMSFVKNTQKHQNINKQTLVHSELNKTPGSNKNQSKSADDENKSVNSKKHKKSIKCKQRLVRNLSLSSSSNSGDEEWFSNTKKQKRNLRKRLRKSSTKENANSESPRCTMSLRKRQKVETSPDKIVHKDTNSSKHYSAYYFSPKAPKNQELTYIYYHDIPKDDLSEDESM
ncbi:hypothetical protein PUN28_007677 [Cardiocondyla obscurior]|uniref:SANTA domain-containing protein n=1 Tax=Cardiocondyla obscurior TaxID=286306 RepID=A0AAW2G7K9_9HYME